MTEYQQGRILEVAEVRAGSELTVPHFTGDMVLTVFDASDFDEAGGEVEIEGVVYPYLSKDDDLDTVTLSWALEADFPEDTEVWVHPGATVKEAIIQLDEEDAVEARVPHNLIGLLEVGVREENAQESTLVYLDGSEWVIKDLIGQTYSINGGYIPGDTLPDPTIPTTPPGSSPEITDISGSPSAIIVAVENVEPGTWINYYISTQQNFTEGPNTLYVSTQATVAVITSLPDGSALVPETTYYVKVLAENAVGSAPELSEEKSAQLDLNAIATLITERLVAGFILTGRIQIGQAYIDADIGIVVPQPDGGAIRLPIDGSAATITAHLIARSLTVEDQWSFFGAGRMGGTMTIQNKIANPTLKPTLSVSLPNWPIMAWAGSSGSGTDMGWFFSGLARYDSTTYLVVADNDWGVGIRSIDSRTSEEGSSNGHFGSTTNPFVIGPAWADRTRLVGGFTRVGTGDYYVILKDNNRGGDTYIYRLNSAGGKVSELRLGGPSTFTNRPTLTSDGTNLLMVWVSADNNLNLRTYKPDLSGSVVADRALINMGKAYTVLAAAAGPTGGDAVNRLTIFLGAGNDAQTRTFRMDSWARVTAEEFAPAGPGQIRGIIYDTTLGRFVGYTQQSLITRYSKLTQSIVATARYTWYDGDTTTAVHESAGSPAETIVVPARRWLRVETPPAPDIVNTDPLLTDKANRIGVYLSSNPAITPRREVYWPVGTRAGSWEIIPNTGVSYPTVSNFETAASAQGRIRSAAGDTEGKPLIELMGDGSGRVGPLVWNDQGKPTSTTTTVTLSGHVTGELTLTKVAGMVIVRGVCSRDNWTSGTAFIDIGTIPVGWRPPTSFPTAGFAASNGVFYQYQFHTDGRVQVRQASDHTNAMYVNEAWPVS